MASLRSKKKYEPLAAIHVTRALLEYRMNAFKLLAAAPHRTRESRLVRWKDSRVKTGGPDGHHIPPSASPSPRPNRTTSSASAGFDLWVMRGRSSCFLASVRVRVRPSVRRLSVLANSQCNVQFKADGQTDRRPRRGGMDYSSFRDENLRKFSIRPPLWPGMDGQGQVGWRRD